MDIYERINQLIKEKKLTKRDFARRLIALEPKLKSTGEIPTGSGGGKLGYGDNDNSHSP